MRMRRPSNVERAAQTDSTLLRNASAITGQKKCWELFAPKSLTNFKICAATPTTQNTKHHATEFMAVKMSRKRSGFGIFSYIKDSTFLELKRDSNF